MGKAFPESLEVHDDVGMMHISAYQCFSPAGAGVTHDWCISGDKNLLTCLKTVRIISFKMPVSGPIPVKFPGEVLFVGLILTHPHGAGDSFDLSIIPAVTWNSRAFDSMPLYAKTAGLSNKTGKFSF